MTFKELISFISSFQKVPGEFTRDEIFEIGKAHRQVEPAKDKSWAFIKDVVGWEGSTDSLRMYVNTRMKREMKSCEDWEKDCVCDQSESLPEDPFESKLSKLYIEKTKFRDLRNSVNRTLRDEARIDDIKNIIREEIALLPELPAITSTEEIEDDRYAEAILPICDLHLGAAFKNSYNEYNLDIAVSRLKTLLAKTIKYCKDHHVKKLNVINMGDMISGNIHVTLRIEAMEDAISQTMKAAELLAQFINELSVAVPEITYRTVSDNHSRINTNKNEHIEKENLNRVIDWFIEERLKDSKVVFMHDNLDIGVGRFVLQNGKKVFFMHGHEDKKSTVMQDMVGLSKEFPDYILMAHFHNSAEHTFQNAKVFVSGSIMGTDTYAYSHRLFSEPEQRLLVFSGNDLINVEIKL